MMFLSLLLLLQGLIPECLTHSMRARMKLRGGMDGPIKVVLGSTSNIVYEYYRECVGEGSSLLNYHCFHAMTFSLKRKNSTVKPVYEKECQRKDKKKDE